MRISLNTSDHRWYDNLWASLIFFTRLPFWRLYQPPRECYRTVVEHWPLTGWLTAAVMAATLWAVQLVLPYSVAVLAAIAVRIMLTGALHEDGLADFMDGFGGGGTDRNRILAIMKDSRIGTYGVIGLTLYLALLFFTLSALPPALAALTILAADPYSKMVAGQIILMLPYARTEEESKAKTVYRHPDWKAGVSMAVQGMVPPVAYILLTGTAGWQYLIFVPCVVMYFLYLLIGRRLKGYTGDCCGALFLLVELSFYITVCACYNTNLIHLHTTAITF